MPREFVAGGGCLTLYSIPHGSPLGSNTQPENSGQGREGEAAALLVQAPVCVCRVQNQSLCDFPTVREFRLSPVDFPINLA